MIKPEQQSLVEGLPGKGNGFSDVDESVGEVLASNAWTWGVGPMTRAMLLQNTVDAAAISLS